MPIKTNLGISPYFVDFDPNKKYYETLFKPSVAVQTRELNNMQFQIQSQIERFGDNIFKSGTIVSGCNFSFYPAYCYVKLSDNSTAGVPIDPSLYRGMFAKNSANLQAYVMDSIDGFESTDPNLKTIFVRYINSGNTGELNAFSSGETLTIINGRDSLFSIDIVDGSSGFSNNDTLIVSPSLEVNVSSGTFSNGDYVNDPTFGSNAQIVGIHTLVGSNNYIFDILPRSTDLANSAANSSAWAFSAFDAIHNSANTAQGTIVKVHGSGAAGRLITDALGAVSNAFFTDEGEGYDFLPQLTIRSSNNSSGISSLNLTPINYFDKIKVASVASPVGNGYAFGVSEGVVYQAGHFLKVDPQIIIVNAYSSSPNNVSVGFSTQEEIIDYNIDASLTDNVLGTENENAPGADRLKLTPTLIVANTANALSNSEFLSLVFWNDGNPFRQNQTSIYSKIGDEMASRTADASGNFVLDPFLVTTASPANSALEGSKFTVVVDPGTAYIDGYKITTNRNFKIDISKASTTLVSNNRNVSLNYDAYIRVKEVGGLFQFSTGDSVDLYNTAKNFLSNTALVTAGNTTPQGTKIGTARVRSMLLENGVAGDSTAIYRLFLFNIKMNTGANFRDVRSVYYNGTVKGIADAVLELDATTAANVAVLKNANNNTLVFPTGGTTLRNTNNTIYTYRTIDQTANVANSGLLVKSIASNPDELYPYSSPLSSADLSTLYVVPTGNTLTAFANLSGTVSVNTTSANMVGSSTSFITDLAVGDYVSIGNATANTIKKVVGITNNTLVTLDSNFSFSNGSAKYFRCFPKYAPVPFGTRNGLSANLDVNQQILTLDFGMTFAGTTTVNTAIGVNIKRTGVTSVSKTANRSQFVKMCLANNAANTVGPWCLGVSDAFRLRHVYVGNSSVNTSSVDMVSEFFLDENQNTNYLDLSYIGLVPKSSLSLTSDNYLLVCFDYFSKSDDGYCDTVSYTGTSNATLISNLDSLPLANLSTHAASFEIPELYGDSGQYYDLMGALDFRPAVVNTVATATNASSAPLNPAYTLSFGNTADSTNDKKFPVPDSLCTLTVEEYMGRTDVVVIGPDGNIVVQQGHPSIDPAKRLPPNIPQNNLLLNKITVPPYPNITINPSSDVIDVVSTLVQSKNGPNYRRVSEHVIYPLVANTQTAVPTQPMGYTMAQIGALERRIADLEYYTGLSALETSITNKVIPSSIDGTLNRFKFGFSADDFSTTIYSALSDPQYSAEIETINADVDTTQGIPQQASNFCVPSKFRFPLVSFAPSVNMPYIDFPIIDQTNATTEPPEAPPISNCVPTTSNVTTITSGNSLFFMSTVKQGTETGTVKMGTLSGNATLFYHFPYDPFIQIYQTAADPSVSTTSNPTLLITSASADALTANDKNYLLSNDNTKQFWKTAAAGGNPNYKGFIDSGGIDTNFGVFNKTANGWVYGSGKIEFTHNPENGRYYIFKTTAGYQGSKASDPYFGGFYHLYEMVQYPVDITGTSTIVNPCGAGGTSGGGAGTGTGGGGGGSSGSGGGSGGGTGGGTGGGGTTGASGTPVTYDGTMSAILNAINKQGTIATGGSMVGIAYAQMHPSDVLLSDMSSPMIQRLGSAGGWGRVAYLNITVFTISLEAHGLMPSTAHTISVDGYNFPAKDVKPAGGTWGAVSNTNPGKIYTDNMGRVAFTLRDSRFNTGNTILTYYGSSHTFALDAASSHAHVTTQNGLVHPFGTPTVPTVAHFGAATIDITPRPIP